MNCASNINKGKKMKISNILEEAVKNGIDIIGK